MGCVKSNLNGSNTPTSSKKEPLSKRQIESRREYIPEVSSFQPNSHTTIRYAYLNQRGYYPYDPDKPNQDKVACVSFPDTDQECTFMAVFDGHGDNGHTCAEFAKKYLPELIQKSLANRTLQEEKQIENIDNSSNVLEEHERKDQEENTTENSDIDSEEIENSELKDQKENTTENSDIDSEEIKNSELKDQEENTTENSAIDSEEIENSELKDQEENTTENSAIDSEEIKEDERKDQEENTTENSAIDSKEIEEDERKDSMLPGSNEIEQCCCDAHVECNRLMHEDDTVNDRLCGTTAISAFFYDEGMMTVCNVGDSRAIMGKLKDEETASGKLQASALSIDQTPYRKDERERVKKAGARVLTLDQIDGKQPIHENWDSLNLGEVIDQAGDPPRLWKQTEDYPGTGFTRSIGDQVADEIGAFAVPETMTVKLGPSCKIVVLASDGVFEFLTNQQVIDMCAQFDDPLEACRAVATKSYKLWLETENRTDDISMICMFIDVKEDSSTD